MAKLSLEQYLDLKPQDIRLMKPNELRTAVRTLGKTANERIQSFEGKNASPAVAKMIGAGQRGMIETKGLTVNQLRSEFTRARNFLTSGQSTPEEWEEVQKETRKRVSDALGVEPEELEEMKYSSGKYFAQYDKLIKNNPWASDTVDKYEYVKRLRERTEKGQTLQNAYNNMRRKLKKEYNRRMEELQAEISDFFTPSER